MRLIDADALIREECGSCDGHCNTFDGEECLKCTSHNKCQFREDIDAAPTVNAVPVVHCGECIHRVRGSWAKCTGRRPYEFCSDGESRFKNATE